jgi:hypothetical protein
VSLPEVWSSLLLSIASAACREVFVALSFVIFLPLTKFRLDKVLQNVKEIRSWPQRHSLWSGPAVWFRDSSSQTSCLYIEETTETTFKQVPFYVSISLHAPALSENRSGLSYSSSLGFPFSSSGYNGFHHGTALWCFFFGF